VQLGLIFYKLITDLNNRLDVFLFKISGAKIMYYWSALSRQRSRKFTSDYNCIP